MICKSIDYQVYSYKDSSEGTNETELLDFQ